MLYLLNLQVEQTTKETIFGEREISGSLTPVSSSAYYITTLNQTKLVEATDETEARAKIETYYVEQMNKIIEAINYASDSYWGDPQRFKFKASIDSYSTAIEVSDNTNRIIKGTFTIKLFGYIVPDTIQKDVTAIKKYNSKAQVIIGLEAVDGNNAYAFTGGTVEIWGIK